MSTHERNIVVVEDDKPLAEAYQEVFEIAGYQAHLIHDGGEALAYFRNHVPDIIFLDMHLPSVNGLDILHYLKGDDRFATTQIVVMTADNTLKNQAELYTATLFKPVSLDTLLAQLNKLIEA